MIPEVQPEYAILNLGLCWSRYVGPECKESVRDDTAWLGFTTFSINGDS